MLTTWLISLIAAYLIGSIPFGLIIGRLHGIDIRQHGSRNIGATNIGRVLGKKFGLLCFLLDALKGFAGTFSAGLATGTLGTPLAALSLESTAGWIAIAIAAVLGHMYSLFIGFKGGKGVATGFGALLGMWPILTIPALLALGVWIITLTITRYISIASMSAAVTLPIWAAILAIATGSDIIPRAADRLWAAWPLVAALAGLAALVIWKHRTNLVRLKLGTEPAIGRKNMNPAASPASPDRTVS